MKNGVKSSDQRLPNRLDFPLGLDIYLSICERPKSIRARRDSLQLVIDCYAKGRAVP